MGYWPKKNDDTSLLEHGVPSALLHLGAENSQGPSATLETECAREGKECDCNGQVRFGKTTNDVQYFSSWRDNLGVIACNARLQSTRVVA